MKSPVKFVRYYLYPTITYMHASHHNPILSRSTIKFYQFLPVYTGIFDRFFNYGHANIALYTDFSLEIPWMADIKMVSLYSLQTEQTK